MDHSLSVAMKCRVKNMLDTKYEYYHTKNSTVLICSMQYDKMIVGGRRCCWYKNVGETAKITALQHYTHCFRKMFRCGWPTSVGTACHTRPGKCIALIKQAKCLRVLHLNLVCSYPTYSYRAWICTILVGIKAGENAEQFIAACVSQIVLLHSTLPFHFLKLPC